MVEKLLKAKRQKLTTKKGAENGGADGVAGRAVSTKPPQAIALVGTYREKQLAWIKKNGVYNYPVKEGDEFDAAAFGKIKELWLYAGSKGKRHCFAAAFVGKMTREEFLAAYPTYADIGRASVAPSGRASVSSSGRASVSSNGRAVSTKPPHDESAPKDKISLLIKSENREYYVFKVSFLDYGPKLDNPQVVIRAMDFATGRGRARLVKKAFDQFKQDGEFAPLAAYLPSALSVVPHGQLRVCEAAVQMNYVFIDHFGKQSFLAQVEMANHKNVSFSDPVRTSHILVNGDSRNMTYMPAESVELIVTSPPYWQLKDYGIKQQIGFHDSYEDYINDLNLVWSECNRILKPGCRLCINIGDQFARAVYYGRYKVIPIRTEIIRFCETLGLDYMGAIIWQKQTTMNTTGGGAVMGSFPYPRNGILKIDYEFILIFKKQGKSPLPTLDQKKRSEMSKDEWNKCFSSHWTFGGARQDGHIAVFPEELPARLIKMFTFTGETVFDPFMGSGTTAMAARHLGRNSIGYEINKDFRGFYENKVCGADLLCPAYFGFENDAESFVIDPGKSALPYIFHDPLKLDNKIDIKRLQFGSKIDGSDVSREEYFSVTEVLSPTSVRLSSGIEVRLLGIVEDPSKHETAMRFIYEKTRHQKVFVKYDNIKYGADGKLLVYLYLENKTFVNAHLIKQGLVLVDETLDFHHKARFINYRKEAVEV